MIDTNISLSNLFSRKKIKLAQLKTKFPLKYIFFFAPEIQKQQHQLEDTPFSHPPLYFHHYGEKNAFIKMITGGGFQFKYHSTQTYTHSFF